MKLGRFIVDTHVHSQRHAAAKKLQGSTDYGDLGRAMMNVDAYDNSARLLYDMDCYGVDMCVLEPAFGMSNEINVEQTKKYPDRFVANCQANLKHTMDKYKAEGKEWTMNDVCDELESLLKTGNYVGIGEAMPIWHDAKLGSYPEYETELSMMKNMFMICDVARKYKVPIRFHCGLNVGYEGHYHLHQQNYNPLWAHDIAINYPDVPLIMEHAGIEGWWWEHLYEACLHVAASHNNVYLETGRWWTELYTKAMADPNIGAEKLIWGTDWGASLPIHWQPGRYPQTYTEQNRKSGIIRYQVDIFGWSLKQIQRLNVPQDDMNLILGGNAIRIYNLRTPGGLSRMFKI